MRIGVFLLGLAALGSANALQAETRVLEPSSHWALDYAKDKCRLTRTFGGEEDRTVLIFDQYGPPSFLQAVVAGSALDKMRTGRDMEVQYGPYFESWTITPAPSTLGDFGDAILISGRGSAPGTPPAPTPVASAATAAVTARLRLLPGRALEAGEAAAIAATSQLDPEEGKRIEWLEIRQGKRVARLDTGNLEAPYRALNSCIDDLVAHWGLDPVQQRALVRRPKWINQGEVAQEIIAKTYPRKAALRGEQAMFHFRVMIDEAGRPEDCVLTNITTADNFGDEPCEIIMRNARFEPARDEQGAAAPSFYASRIRYAMPK